MALPEGIQLLPIQQWTNVHQNFTQTFAPNASYTISLPASVSDIGEQYKRTTANFQWLIQNAINNGQQLRAMGSGWSLSEVAVSDGGIVDTKNLTLSFNMGNSFISPQYLANGRQAHDLFFVQCGMTILMLNDKLEKESDPKRALKASGASNGQSIAGATSTGTHGAAINDGAVHDSIVGLHIVVGPSRHVWLERASYPIASDDFINWLGAEVIRDDDMFNAALVSFGSFGFIHGIMLETDPIYLLEKHPGGMIPYNDELKQAIDTLDFTNNNILPLPENGPDKQLYHFEIVINPHQFAPNDPNKGAYLRTIYKCPYVDSYQPPVSANQRFEYGDDTLGVIQTVLDAAGSDLSALIIPALVDKLFPLAYASSDATTATIGDTFINTKFRGKVGSAAIGVDISNASRVAELITAASKQTPFPGGLGLRFVKGTQAMLGFTYFPHTCVLEMDGVDAQASRDFFQNIWTTLRQQNIPYTMHWGKLNFAIDADLVLYMYGPDKVNKWIQCRNALLDAPTRQVFTNDFIQKCGLAKDLAIV